MREASEQDAGAEDCPFLRVECYAGHRADTEPRSFWIADREVAVRAVIDRWLDRSHRYFKLRGGDGGIYRLRYDTVSDRWKISLHDSGRRDDTRLSSTFFGPWVAVPGRRRSLVCSFYRSLLAPR